jgi:hypothetical protein
MLTEVTCVVVRCDGCGRSAFDSGDGGDYDNEAHFDTVTDAEETVRGADWIVVGDRVTCCRCVEKATCDLTGHDWGEWQPFGPRDLAGGGVYIGELRHCGTCGRGEWNPPLEAAG